MNDENVQNYGAWIRERRISRGLSTKQIAAETRIDEQYLKALESGNIALLPEPYMRAFLKTYSSYLGLDPGEALHRFEDFLKDQSERLERVRGSVKDREGKRQQDDAAVTYEIEREIPGSNEDFKPKREISKRSGMMLAAAVIVVFAAIVYVAVYFTGSMTDPGDSIPAAEPSMTGTGSEQVQQQQVAAPEVEIVPVPEPPPLPIEQETEEQILTAEALEETWMEARADGRLTVSRVIPVGNIVRLAFADTLELLLGKNRGMRLILNGEEITDLGPPDMVLRLLVTPQGVAERRLTYPPETIPSILNIPPHL